MGFIKYNRKGNKTMDYAYEATKILHENTNAYMQGVYAKYDSNREMMEDMYNNCAFILTNYLIEGKYTPMQFNAIRNELGKAIWNIFERHIKVEEALEKLKQAQAKEEIARKALLASINKI